MAPHPLDCFVPRLVTQWLHDDPSAQQGQPTRTLFGAVMFADISGFSPLASALSSRGSEGAEELNRLLNQYYARYVDLLMQWGGDILRFAGDATLVFWEAASAAELTEASWRAARCAMELQEQLHDFPVEQDVRLSMRISLTSGELNAMLAGDGDGYRQLVVYGKLLSELRVADAAGRAGWVVVSPNLANQLKSHVQTRSLGRGAIRLEQVNDLPTPLLPCPALPAPALSPEQLRPLVLNTVLEHYDAGQLDWMSDLRRLTTVFLRLQDAAAETQVFRTVMSILQSSVRRYEGTVLQLIEDDKGVVGVLSFGLPPSRQEDCAARGVRAAWDIQQSLAAQGLNAAYGISTGDVFCGPLGSEERREYLLLGDVVNLAARLMQASKGEVLVDATTYESLGGSLATFRRPDHLLKGIGIVRVYEAMRDSVAARQQLLIDRPAAGRALDAFLAMDDGADSAGEEVEAIETLVFKGDAGVGKSTVVDAARRKAAANGWKVCYGAASSLERHTLFYVWRAVLRDLYQLPADREARTLKIQAWMSERPDVAPIAPLLNSVLDITLEETPLSRQLAGQDRGDSTRSLLRSLLESEVGSQRLLLVIDDAHWMDSASWKAVADMARLNSLKIVLAMRPLEEPVEDWERLRGLPSVEVIAVDALQRDEQDELVRRHLHAEVVSTELSDHLWERSQGNPFFVKEIIDLLRDSSAILVDGGRCRLHASQSQGVLSIPGTVRDVVASRIGQLPLGEQLTLKAASVIGRVFRSRTLREIYPVREQAPNVSGHLEVLSNRGLIEQLQRTLSEGLPDAEVARLEFEGDASHHFHHVIVQQVAYYELPVAQRRRLHQDVAQWYESQGELERNSPLLAYHWSEAEVPEKEIVAWQLAGAEALRSGSYRESVNHLERALFRHLEVFPHALTDPQRQWRGHCQRMLGEARFCLGDMEGSCQLLQESLATNGMPMPRGKLSRALGIAAQLTKQIWYQLRRRQLGAIVFEEPQPDETRRLAALAFERLAQIYYFSNDAIIGSFCALRALNLGELLPDSPVLARSYANGGIVMAIVGQSRLAAHYARRAERTARRMKHLPSLCYALSVNSIFYMGEADWDRMLSSGSECVKLAAEIKNPRAATEGVTVLAMRAAMIGQWDEAEARFGEVERIARQTGNDLHQAWADCGLGEVLMRTDRQGQAMECFAEAQQRLMHYDSPTEIIRATGMESLCWLRTEDIHQAEAAAIAAEQVIAENEKFTPSALEGIAGLFQTRLWQLGHAAPHDRTRLAKALAHVRRSLQRYAKVYRVGRPRWLRCQALQHWQQGRQSRAVRLLNKSLEQAEILSMPVEQMHADLTLAAWTGDEPAMRRATELAESLNMPRELCLAELLATGAEIDVGLI